MICKLIHDIPCYVTSAMFLTIEFCSADTLSVQLSIDWIKITFEDKY